MIVAFSAACPVSAASTAPIAFIPLDDRPVTLQLPIMLGDIAGRPVLVPPLPLLGHYLTPGDSEGLLAWLASFATKDAASMLVSTDMIAYGGLVASRTPDVAWHSAIDRLRELARIHRARPRLPLEVFGTIMRLAPTGLPHLPVTARYWVTDGTVDRLAEYANLPDPPQTPEQRAQASSLREQIGATVLRDYLVSRARNREVDSFALQLTAQGAFDRIVIGQDDAGPIGLHVRDVATLTTQMNRLALGPRAAIEPGADELGMLLLAARFANDASWQPTVRVRYSRAGAEEINDPLEFEPLDLTISRLIQAGGARRTEGRADIDLFVNVSGTGSADERAFVDAITGDITSGVSTAVADLTFVGDPNPSKEQQRLTEELIARGIAGSIDAFASWNTTANTVGTALAAAFAVGAGKRTGTYDALAHARFLLNRYVDDYAFHQFVRPLLNKELRANAIDPTLLVPSMADMVENEARELVWGYAQELLAEIYPQYKVTGMSITLPWQRTFEVKINIGLTK